MCSGLAPYDYTTAQSGFLDKSGQINFMCSCSIFHALCVGTNIVLYVLKL